MAEQSGERGFGMPATEEQQPCAPSIFKLPDPRNSSDLDHLMTKLDISSFAIQALFRERHSLRTSIRTQTLHIQYLQRSRESLCAQLDSLSSDRDEVIAQRDDLAQELSKLKSSHSALLNRFEGIQSEVQRVRTNCSDLQRRNAALSKSKSHLDRALMTNRTIVKRMTTQQHKLEKAAAESSEKISNLQSQIGSWQTAARDAINELGITVNNKDSDGKNRVAQEVGLLKDACTKWKSKCNDLVPSGSGIVVDLNEGNLTGNPVTRSASELTTRRTRSSLGNKGSVSKEVSARGVQRAQADTSEWKTKYDQIVKQIEVDSMKTGARIAQLTQTVSALRNESSHWKEKLTAALTSHDKELGKKTSEPGLASKATVENLQNERDEWRRKFEALANNSARDGSVDIGDAPTPEGVHRASGSLLSPAPLQKAVREATSESESRLTNKLPFVIDDDMEEVEVVETEEAQPATGNSIGMETRKSPENRFGSSGVRTRGRRMSKHMEKQSPKTKAGIRKTSTSAPVKQEADNNKGKGIGGKRAREDALTPARHSKSRRLSGRLNKGAPSQSTLEGSGTRTTRLQQRNNIGLNQASLERATPTRKSNVNNGGKGCTPVSGRKDTTVNENVQRKPKDSALEEVPQNATVPPAESAGVGETPKRGSATITVRVSRASSGLNGNRLKVDVKRSNSGKQTAGGSSRDGSETTDGSGNGSAVGDKSKARNNAVGDKAKSKSNIPVVTKTKRGSSGNEGALNGRSLRPRRSVSYNYDQEGRDVVNLEQAMSLHKGKVMNGSDGQTPGSTKGRRASTRSVGTTKKSDERTVATRVSTRRSSGTGGK